jgi:heme exporter protein B
MAVSVIVIIVALLVVANLAIPNTTTTTTVYSTTATVVWLCMLIASFLVVMRSFIIEHDQIGFQGLTMCPVPRDAIYLGKVISNLVFLLAIESVLFPLSSILFNIPLLTLTIVAITVPATLGIAGAGTLFAAMSVNTKAREILLPVLFFPAVIPIILAAIDATQRALQGTTGSALWQDIGVLAVLSIAITTTSAILFTFAMDE